MDIGTYHSIVGAIGRSEVWEFDATLTTLLAAFPQENHQTIRSIVSHEYQKHIKVNFKQSHSGENRRRVYERFQARVERGDRPGIIIALAREERTAPALAAKIVLEEYLKENQVLDSSSKAAGETQIKAQLSQLMRNPFLIDDRDLAYEILLANVQDHGYGPIGESIKHSIGEEHEQKAKDCLKALNIPFSDEHVLRNKGYDKTPDIKLEVPISVNGKIVNWIESKALFGDIESHEGYLRDQFWSYWNRFGSGLVIYWFGYIKQLDNNREAGILLADSFPTDITFYNPLKLTRAGPSSTPATSSQTPFQLSDSLGQLTL